MFVYPFEYGKVRLDYVYANGRDNGQQCRCHQHECTCAEEEKGKRLIIYYNLRNQLALVQRGGVSGPTKNIVTHWKLIALPIMRIIFELLRVIP